MDDSNYERARSTIADLRDRMKENQGRRGQSGRQQGQGQGQGQGQTPREESTQTGGQQYNPGDTYSIDGVQAEVIDVAPDGRLRVRNPQTGQEAIVTPES